MKKWHNINWAVVSSLISAVIICIITVVMIYITNIFGFTGPGQAMFFAIVMLSIGLCAFIYVVIIGVKGIKNLNQKNN